MALEGDSAGLLERTLDRLDLAQHVNAIGVVFFQGAQDAFQVPFGDGKSVRAPLARTPRHAQAMASRMQGVPECLAVVRFKSAACAFHRPSSTVRIRPRASGFPPRAPVPSRNRFLSENVSLA